MSAERAKDNAEFSPVSAPGSKITHAVSIFIRPTQTACGREFRGWKMSLRKLNCAECQRAIGLDCRTRKRKKSRKAVR